MKNKLYTLIIFLVVLCAPEFVFAQARTNAQARPGTNTRTSQANNRTNAAKSSTSTSTETKTSDSSASAKRSDIPNYTLAQNKSFAHWSIGLGIGGSLFDGDINEDVKRIVPSALLDYTFTGNIERTFNPIFGFGLGYAYMPYAADPKGTNLRMKGIAQEGDIYLSVNMANLFYRSRPQRWGIFCNIGMGISYYNAKMTDKTTGAVVTSSKNHGLPMDLKDGLSFVWPFSATVEYNISKYFACGLKAEYRLHDKDNYEGYTVNIREGNWNDAFEVLTLTLRYKPHFGKAYHVRNLSYGEMSLRDINRRLAEMENMIKSMAKGDSCCANNTDRINKMEKQLAKKADNDFVIKEIEKAIQDVPAVNVNPVPASNTGTGEKGVVDDKTKKVFNEALRGIQFETAKADIKPVSYPILEKVVVIMKENPKFELDIIGHTDNVGDAKANLDLSDRRAHAVRTFLMNKGIESIRLTSLGKGLTEPIATNNTAEGRALNRRVEFVVKQGGQILFKSEGE